MWQTNLVRVNMCEWMCSFRRIQMNRSSLPRLFFLWGCLRNILVKSTRISNNVSCIELATPLLADKRFFFSFDTKMTIDHVRSSTWNKRRILFWRKRFYDNKPELNAKIARLFCHVRPRSAILHMVNYVCMFSFSLNESD
jgi:hypothetical protein